MKQFWETGEFPFSFAKNDPAKAADIFAKMFQQQTPEQGLHLKMLLLRNLIMSKQQMHGWE